MGQIPNYSKHRPRKIIYINKAVYEETDGERSMLAIIGYGTAKFSYQLTPTLVEPITDTIIALDEIKTDTAPESIEDFGTNSVLRKTVETEGSESDILYIDVADWVQSSPIGTLEVPDAVAHKNVTFAGYANVGGLTKKVEIDLLVDDSTSGIYSVDLLNLSTTGIVIDGDTYKPIFDQPFRMYVKADFKLGGNTDDGLVLINNNVVDKLGPATDPDNNPLAFAASLAVTAGSGKPFYVVAYDNTGVTTATQMNEALEPALRQLSVTDRAVYLVGLCKYTESTNKAPAIAMFQALENHVDAMSTEEEQKWRRVYIYSNPSVSSASSMSQYVETVTQQVTDISTSFENERVINVWADHAQYATINPDTGDKELKDLDNMFIAVGIAALRAASQPHQGLSKTNLPWINNVKASYLKFIPSELDTIASYGTFIVCQDDAASDVYIRHQLSTETDLGLMYWEDSAGTNVDNIAYGIKDVVEPYPGRYNIVNNALIEIEKSVADYLTGLTTTGISTEDMRLGPQLIHYENLKVWVHKQLRDRIVISVDLVVPVPMNVVEVHLNAYITVDFEAETA